MTDTFTTWLGDDFLPGIVIVIGGVLIVRAVGWLERRHRRQLDSRIVASLDRDDVASERLKQSRAVVQAVGWAARVVVIVASLTFGVTVMGVPLATFVAPATVASVAIGFGAQAIVGDLLAGFFLLAEKQFGYGDVIRFASPGDTGGVTGTVEELNLRVTKLRTVSGELVIIPNGSLRQVTNLSKEWSRAVVDLPIATDEDLLNASAVLQTAAHEMTTVTPWADLMLGDPVVFGVESFEIGYVRVRVVARTLPGRQFEVARELRLRLATALTEAGIATIIESEAP